MGTDILKREKLTYEEVDNLSAQVDSFLRNGDMDEMTRKGVRLTMEDMILSVCETMGEDTPFMLTTGVYFKRPFIRFSYKGVAFDPTEERDDFLSGWSNRFLADIGLSPIWSYKNGVNTLQLKLKRKSIGSIGTIAIALILALIIGFGGQAILSESIRNSLCDLFLVPLQSLFFRLLSIFGGFMIFLCVCCGIFNMGDTSSFSKTSSLIFRNDIYRSRDKNL